MEKWFVAAKKADFEKNAKRFAVSPILARIIRNRDLIEETEIEKFLYGTKADCYAPEQMKNMKQAALLLWKHIEAGRKIRIIGDYDVDGVCSTYILYRGLQDCHANVDYVIPHRIRDGYGLNEQLIAEAKEDGIHTILTCDNGIAAYEQIAYANELGMTVIVTDHHEVPFTEKDGVRTEQLPPAAVVVDPKQQECEYPFKGICGAVVAYKLVQALMQTGALSWTREEELLQFAAIATVCDVMELKDENRIIVKEGLKLLRNRPSMGIKALAEVNGIEPERLDVYHLGFVIGPCINATGRLDTAVKAMKLLQSKEWQEAVTIAGELKELNDSRKSMTLQGVKQAEEQIEQAEMEQDKVLVVYLQECHESLAGIIAGRIREKYNKPVFVLTRGEQELKGSGRSIETYHMYEQMSRVKELFIQFGGHKMAAGLSMKEENLPLFRKKINEICELTEEDFIPRVHIDIPMPISYATLGLVKEMELLEPFGNGNPKPLFAQKDLRFLKGRKIGKNRNFAKFEVEDEGGIRREMMYFGDGEEFDAFLDRKFGIGSAQQMYSGQNCDFSISVTYQLSVNTYMGKESLQVIMQNYQ